jgi:hypothetical protein
LKVRRLMVGIYFPTINLLTFHVITANQKEEDSMAQDVEIREVKERHKDEILVKPNVVGVGIGYKTIGNRRTDELSIIALVRQKVPPESLPPGALIPQEVNGARVDVLQVGQLRAFQAPTDRWRPAPGGVSIGHYQITAGTLGCVVRDRRTGSRLILSNNHVLANSNSASPGDAILQPGAYDGGNPNNDTIAHLERFVPIQFSLEPGSCSIAKSFADIANLLARLIGSSHRLDVLKIHQQAINQVDAAVARPVEDGVVSDEILEIGTLTGTAPATLGMAVRKSGRTTGFTRGEISVIAATVNVTYGAGRVATFDNQLVAGPMSQGGDSGSLVAAGDSPRAVGLLFAGSDQSTIFSPIQLVLDALEVNITATQQNTSNEPDRQAASLRAQEVRRTYEQELLSKPNVVGVGVGVTEKGGQPTGQVGVVVLVDKKMPIDQLNPQDLIPTELEGVPVDVKEVGRLRAF